MKLELLQHKSGGGRFRVVYLLPDGRVEKVPRKFIAKKYPFGVINFPARFYARLKFGDKNINAVDFNNYQSLPELIRKQYCPKYVVVKEAGKERFIQDRVLDYDGNPSLSINEFVEANSKILNPVFWKHIDNIKSILLSEKKYLLGVFYGGSNIMVQKVSETEWKPVIIDFKRLGERSYPFQPNLRIRDNLKQKFLRKYAIFEASYRTK